MGWRLKIFLCIFISIILIVVDQVSKMLAVHYLQGKGVVNVLGDFMIFKYIQNRGAFLSLGSGLGDAGWVVFFVILPTIALLAVTGYIFVKKVSNPYYLAVWVLVLSGGVGNLIDRIMHGKVTDFINFGIGNLRTGILNIADLYICFFAVIIILYYVIISGKKEAIN